MNKNIAILLYCYIAILVILIMGIGWQYWRQLPTPNNSCLSRLAGQDASCSGQASRFHASPAGGPLPTSSLPDFSLESIFSPNHSWVDRLPSDQTITLITTGDVIPARTVNYKMNQYQNFRYPFEKTADFLRKADITLINLESPLIKDCPVTNEGMVFCGDQQFIEGLKFAGVDVVNLANNHSLNYGESGLMETIDLLTTNGILVSGYQINNLVIKQLNNIKLGFLGWNLLDQFDQLDLLERIKQAKIQADILIVSLHWGAEYTLLPAEWQRRLAEEMIDNGADLIVGNHPHWIQPVEIYKKKLIIYAHGNFIFDQEWSQETKLGIIGKHTFYNGDLVDSQFYPVKISDYSQPQLLENQEKETVLRHLENISL